MSARRKYPSRPLVGAGAVVHRNGDVLLVKRRYPPNQGKWALPGGLVNLGETVQEAARREVREETGLKVRIEGLLDVGTDIHIGRNSRTEYHYVLVDYVAAPSGGRVRLDAESTAYGWFSRAEVRDLETTEGTRKVLKLYFARRDGKGIPSARRPMGMRSA